MIMKIKMDIKSLALGILLGAITVFSIAAATRESTPTWEYQFLYLHSVPNHNLIGAINTAAIEGWEVVNYTADNGMSVLLKRARK